MVPIKPLPIDEGAATADAGACTAGALELGAARAAGRGAARAGEEERDEERDEEALREREEWGGNVTLHRRIIGKRFFAHDISVISAIH
jgi:hypothetical protein